MERHSCPRRRKRGDAGYDLYSPASYTIEPGKRLLINTGVSLAIPNGYYGRVAARSGLAAKAGIDVLGGVLDSSYRGYVGVILLNTSDQTFSINSGDRIAQLIIEACFAADFVQVSYLDDTDRGAGGFGHSGR